LLGFDTELNKQKCTVFFIYEACDDD
jgi:hypothetical protein